MLMFYFYLPINVRNYIALKFCFYLCSFELCCLNLFRDLAVFPQTLQMWDTPVMWWASMWSFIWAHWPSLPHTLQILPFLLSVTTFSLNIIMDLILSSRSCWSGATVAATVPSTTVLSTGEVGSTL